MKCPFCKKELKYGGVKSYWSLSEHCLSPNEIPNTKPFYTCETCNFYEAS